MSPIKIVPSQVKRQKLGHLSACAMKRKLSKIGGQCLADRFSQTLASNSDTDSASQEDAMVHYNSQAVVFDLDR